MYVVTDTHKVPSQIPDNPNGCLAAVFHQPRLNLLRHVATLGTDKLRYVWKVVSRGLFEGTNNSIADHSDLAVEVVGLRPLTYWHCGFESHRQYGCLSLVSVVCCEVEVSALG